MCVIVFVQDKVAMTLYVTQRTNERPNELTKIFIWKIKFVRFEYNIHMQIMQEHTFARSMANITLFMLGAE